MRKMYSAKTGLVLIGFMAAALFPVTLSAYTIKGSTVTLTASDRTSDNTVLIQGFLNNAAYTKIIIQPGTNNASWPVKPLFFRHSNTEIHLNANTVLEALIGGYPNIGDCVLRAVALSNIKVTGDAGSEIFMHKEEYAILAPSQWRHALNFMGCSNVVVSGLTLANTGGDGVYVDGVSATGYCSNVTITNVITDGCARNGVSVISVDGLTITGCIFKNTHGLGNAADGGPWAGIDLEPDNSTERLTNIVIDNCKFLNNGYCGFQLGARNLNGSTGILSMTVKNCTMQGNVMYGIEISQVPASLNDSSSMIFQDCTISDNKDVGIYVASKARDGGTLAFINCYLKNNNLATSNMAFSIYNNTDMYDIGGNIQLNNVVIEQPTNRSVNYSLWIYGENSTIDNVSGTIYASGGTLYTRSTTNINVTATSNASHSWWKMDETSGNTVNDSSGNCAGTLLNSPAWTSGRIGGALALNGANQLVTVPNDASLNIGTGNFSVSLWMQLSNSAVTDNRLIYKGASAYNQIGYALSASGGWLGFSISNGVTRISSWCPIPGLDQWHHFAFTVDRVNGKTKAFLDGVYYQPGDLDISAYNGADISNTRDLLIGAADISGSLAWPGKVDDVRIYKRVLTSGEIADFASSASACWRLDDGSGSAATDSIGRSNGVLQNNPAWTTGKLGGALALNGINQFASVSNNSSDLNIGTGDFSISLWMQRSGNAALYNRLLYKGASTDNEIGYALYGSNTYWGLVISNGLNRTSRYCSIPSLDQWHHCVVTIDRASGKAKFYTNGVCQTEMDISAYSGVDISNTRDLLIGAADSSGSLAWPGKVDDVRIYKRVLSADEILRLYSATP